MDLACERSKDEIPVPVCGTVHILWDELGHPAELQTLDEEGRIALRSIRTYDARGRMLEENLLHENPGLSQLPNEYREKMNEKELEALKRAMMTAFSGNRGVGRNLLLLRCRRASRRSAPTQLHNGGDYRDHLQ